MNHILKVIPMAEEKLRIPYGHLWQPHKRTMLKRICFQACAIAAHAAIVKFISAPAGAGGFTDVIAREAKLPLDHSFGPAVLSIVLSDYESAGVFGFVPKHNSESAESKLFAETFSRIESAIEREYDTQKQLALAEFAQLPNWVAVAEGLATRPLEP